MESNSKNGFYLKKIPSKFNKTDQANKKVTFAAHKMQTHQINTNQESTHETNNTNNVFKDIKILYTNADQLTSGKKHELELMVNAEKPDLIAICEIKSKVGTPRQLHEYEFDEYKIANQTNADQEWTW